MYIFIGILNILCGIIIGLIVKPFNNQVVDICISLLFFVDGILDIRKAIKKTTKSTQTVLFILSSNILYFHPIIF